jgi:transcriptional regulator with XRE-family HTH domain
MRPRRVGPEGKSRISTAAFVPLEGFDMSSTSHVRHLGIVFELDLDAIREAITLYELREDATIGQFAEAVGISRMTMWRLLGGHRVSLLTLGRVLRALELDPDAIVRRSDPSKIRGGPSTSELIDGPDTNEVRDDQVKQSRKMADYFFWSDTSSEILG